MTNVKRQKRKKKQTEKRKQNAGAGAGGEGGDPSRSSAPSPRVAKPPRPRCPRLRRTPAPQECRRAGPGPGAGGAAAGSERPLPSSVSRQLVRRVCACLYVDMYALFPKSSPPRFSPFPSVSWSRTQPPSLVGMVKGRRGGDITSFWI